jgi:hypothetical protein
MKILAYIDFAIRIIAALIALTFGEFALLILCAMGTDSGTVGAIAFSAAVFIAGSCVFAAIGLSAIFPDVVAKRVPGPRWIGITVVRIPAYLFGLGGSYLVLRQIWMLHIAPLLG